MDLFKLGNWAKGANKYIDQSPVFDIPLYIQFKMMEEFPALKELWQQYCVFLLLCYNQQQNKDTK